MWLLTHPGERKHPIVKRTGDLCTLCLENCEMLIGRKFGFSQRLVRALKQERCFLLFPTAEAVELGPDHLLEVRKEDGGSVSKCAENLIVIDGTWEFARQLMHRYGAGVWHKHLTVICCSVAIRSCCALVSV